MNRGTAALLLASLILPMPALAQAPASPETRASPEALKEGREHFTRGLVLYREGNFGGAQAEFQRAYDTAPSFRILFNLGQATFELGDYAGAMTAFERYLGEGGDKVPAARRAEVVKSLHDLEGRIGRVDLSTNVPGAEVSVDGVSVGTTPLSGPVSVSVGRRSITASLAGRVPVTKTIDVAGGDRTGLTFELLAPEPAPAALPPAAPAPVVAPEPVGPEPVRPEPARRRSMTPVWVGVGTTGALAATSAVFGVLTLQANSTFKADLSSQCCGATTGIASARSQVHTDALLADIFGSVAIVGAGVTVYFAVSRRASRTPATVGLGPGSARFEMAF